MGPESGDKARAGKLTPQALKKALFLVEANRHIGNIHVSKGDEEKHIYFTVGGIRLFSKGTHRKVPMGKLLVRLGKITPLAMREALIAQKKTGRRIGDVLTKILKLVSQEDINDVVKVQVENEIFDVITWDEGIYEYSASMPDDLFDKRLKATTLSTDITLLINRIKEKIEAWPAIKSKVPDQDAVYKLSPAGHRELIEGQQGGPAMREFATFLDGRRTLKKVVEEGEFGDFEACEMLAGLLDKQQAARVRAGEVASTPEGSGLFEEVRMLEKAVELAPDDHGTREKLVDLYEKAGLREKASRLLRKIADSRFDCGAVEDAAALLERSVRLNPTDFEGQEKLFEAYDKLDQREKATAHGLKLAETYKANRLFNRAKTLLSRILEWEPKNLKARNLSAETHEDLRELQHAVKELETIASILKEQGKDETRLKEIWERILQVDPRHKTARKELRRMILRGQRNVGATIRRAVLAAYTAAVLGALGYDAAGRLLLENLRVDIRSDAEAGDFNSADTKLANYSSWFPLHGRKTVDSAAAALDSEKQRFLRDEMRNLARREAAVLDSPTPDSIVEARNRIRSRLESPDLAESELARGPLDDLQSSIQALLLRWTRIRSAVRSGDSESAFNDYRRLLADYPGFSPGADAPPEPVMVSVTLASRNLSVFLDDASLGPAPAVLPLRIGRTHRLRITSPGFGLYDAAISVETASWPVVLRLDREVAWTIDMGGPVDQKACVCDESLVVASRNRLISGIDAMTGSTIWTYHAGISGDLDSHPVAGPGGLVLCTSRNGSVFGLKPDTGVPAFARDLGSRCMHSPLPITVGQQEQLVAALEDGRVLLVPLRADSAETLLFRAERGIKASPAVFQGVVTAGDSGGFFYAFDVVEGRLKWGGKVQLFGSVSVAPAISEGIVYVGTDAGKVYALDIVEGNILPGWPYSTDSPVSTPPVVLRRMVAVGTEDGHLHMLNRMNGSVEWKVRIGAAIRSEPAESGDSVLFGADDGALYALDLRERVVSWKFQTGGPVRCAPVVFRSTVVFGSDDGKVYALKK